MLWTHKVHILMNPQHFDLCDDVYKSTDHAKPHSICFFYHNTKDNERNLCQDLLTIESTNLDLKLYVLHYTNELLVCVRLSFQTATINHISICFLPQYQRQRKFFFFSQCELKKQYCMDSYRQWQILLANQIARLAAIVVKILITLKKITFKQYFWNSPPKGLFDKMKKIQSWDSLNLQSANKQ